MRGKIGRVCDREVGALAWPLWAMQRVTLFITCVPN